MNFQIISNIATAQEISFFLLGDQKEDFDLNISIADICSMRQLMKYKQNYKMLVIILSKLE